MGLLLVEALVLSSAGAVLGLALGHAFTSVLGAALRAQQQVPVSGWTWVAGELWLAGLALAVGALAALLPAWRASRAEVAPILAEG
jgi:putative ABC transport system permease protein